MQNVLMSEGTADAAMGKYHNEMNWTALLILELGLGWSALFVFITNDSPHRIIILVDSIQIFIKLWIVAATQRASTHVPSSNFQ